MKLDWEEEEEVKSGQKHPQQKARELLTFLLDAGWRGGRGVEPITTIFLPPLSAQ